MSIQQIEKLIHDLVEREIEFWFLKQVENPYGAYYLYYKPMGEDLVIEQDAPEGYRLASPERISPSWTMKEARVKVVGMMAGLPILKGE